MNEMLITKEALSLLMRIVIGCIPPAVKEKRRKNEQHLVTCALKGKDMSLADFRDGLADGTEMYDKIAKFAVEIGWSHIDECVIARYFGGKQHIEKTISELVENGIDLKSKFALHTLLSHVLIPLEVSEVDTENRLLRGIYRNGLLTVDIRNIIFLEADLPAVIPGSIVLTHFPLLVCCAPSRELREYLCESQQQHAVFMEAVQYFSKSMLDHSRIPMYFRWVEESIIRYSL